MKCSKCGFDNIKESEFCANCGSKMEQSSKKKNNKKLFIILGCIVIVIIGGYFLFNKLTKFSDPFEDIDNLTFDIVDNVPKKGEFVDNSLVGKLEEDYKKGNLTSDEYIMEYAYALFDRDKLNSKYKKADLDFNEPSKLFEKAESIIYDLSDETILYLYEKYTLSGNVLWDVENDTTASGISNNLNNYKIEKLVSGEGNLSKISNVKLSSKGNFLIYYSKNGNNAISDETANKISEFLESMVSKYEENYGLNYVYEVKEYNALSISYAKARSLLKLNHIDTKYLDTAMPVYMIDTDADDTGVLGFYLAPMTLLPKLAVEILSLMEDNVQYDTAMTTYAFPYFVVNSTLDDFDETKLVLAHELFHHYQKYICGNGDYESKCPSGNFTNETLADNVAIQNADVNKLGTIMSKHASWYTFCIEESMDLVGTKGGALGYPAFIFASNYAEIISNGMNHLFNSLKTNEPLKYLYDNSGSKYKEVLLTTAKKNLTHDYDNKLLIPFYEDKMYYPDNHQDIGIYNTSKSNRIDYSSMHYYYINPKDYSSDSQLIFSSYDDDLTLLLFVYDNGYKYLKNYSLNGEFIINVDEFSYYNELAFAIVNSEITDHLNYNYEVDNEGGRKPTVTAKELGLKTLDEEINNYSSFVCHYIEEDEDYKTVTQFKIGFDKKDKISEMYFKATIQMKDYNPDDPTFGIAKKIISGLLYVMQETYEEKFKYFKVYTEDNDDKYSVIFKITKNYYEALNDTLDFNNETKTEIIKSFQKEGYVCQYEK